MEILNIVFFICGILFFICAIYLFCKANQIKIKKQKDLERYKIQLKKQIYLLEEKNSDLKKNIEIKKQQIDKELLEEKEKRIQQINETIERQEKIASLELEKLDEKNQKEIDYLKKEFITFKEQKEKEKEQIQKELDKLKNSLNAGLEAHLRQQEEKEKINFYKLSINDKDLADVEQLEKLKSSFNKPVVLSKLIWSQYFQKQMTELCDRVFGKKPICGIYKITNLITKQVYIGQSINIQDRMKQHCKCGLGIDASSTNKLYNSMQKDKVWNFSFELLEECSKELLNEKEAFWINFYSSNIYGLNTTKGIKT